MRRTINITISTNVSNNETENDRLEYQQKMLNMFLGFCKLNIPNCIGVGCTVKDQDFLGRCLDTYTDNKYDIYTATVLQKKLNEFNKNITPKVWEQYNKGE